MSLKNYILLIFSIICPIFCIGQNILDIPISANYQNQPIADILSNLESQYDVYFYYGADFPLENRATIDSKNMRLETFLKTILKTEKIGFESYGNHAVIFANAEKLSKSYDQSYYRAKQLEKQNTLIAKEEGFPIFTVGDPENPSASGQVNINGFVNDDQTKEVLIGASFFIDALGEGTVSDEIGQYNLSLPVGEHVVKIQSIGYQDETIIIQAWSDTNLDINLSKEAVNLGEILVKDKAQNQNVQSTTSGLESLSAKTLKKLPAFLGEVDIIKSIQLLPGVSTVGEAAGGFNVRGGNVDQNLTLQDGMLFFNTAHALGLFSLFNPDFVKNVNLYKGSMPAKFGGRLSSVLDVELKEGNYQKFVGKGGIGLVSSRLTLESPIVKGKSSIILGGRISYADWIFNLVNVADVRESKASFYDTNVKFAQRFGNKGKLTASIYAAHDRFKYAERSDFEWGTQGANLAFQYLLKDNFSFSTEAILSEYKSSLADPEGNDAFDLNNGIRSYSLKPNFLLTLLDHTLNFGAEIKTYEVDQGELSPGNDISTVTAKKLPTEQGREIGIYAQDDYIINDVLSVAVGLRYSFYQNLGEASVYRYEPNQPVSETTIVEQLNFGKGEVIQSYAGLEPRVSLKIGLNPYTSFKLSYNKTQQFINQISNTTAVTPVDIWQLSNLNIRPTTADNYSAGFFKNFDNNLWQTSFELFYRDIHNLIEYRDGADLLINETVERELLTGEGRAYGVELSVKKSIGRWNGWLGYTYSRSERKVDGFTAEESINNGEWFPSNFDRPHDLSLVFSYQITKRTNFSANFVWSSGRPTSVPVGKYEVENVLNIANYSNRNQYRIPDYHRLDVSYTINTNHKKDKNWEGSWTISLFNVYARRNAFSVFFTQKSFQTPKANRLSILGSAFPALTYNFKFL